MTAVTLEHGTVAEPYKAIAKIFRDNLLSGGEIGAACAVVVDGELVVDLWGGEAERSTGRAWGRDTIVPVFSVTKGVAAICILHLVAQGHLDLDAPLARYWPEFGENGKGAVTLRQALAHRAGVPFIDGEIGLEDLARTEQMAARLAAQTPFFVPNSAHSYHAITIGWITSELVRRVTGASLGKWLSANVAQPLNLSLFMGLPPTERERVARVIFRNPAEWDALLAAAEPQSASWKTLTMNGALSFASEMGAASLNDERVQSAELAGAALITNARSLATFYAACLQPIGGVRLLSDDVIADATRPISTGREIGKDIDGPSWGAGVMIPWSIQPMLGSSSFGHDGMGGSLAFADPEHRVGFAYVRNSLATGGVKDSQVYAVVEALRSIVGRRI